MALESISYFLILGKPLVMYLGILTYISLLFTMSIPSYFLKRKKFSLTTHKRMAKVTLLLATIHGILGIAVSF